MNISSLRTSVSVIEEVHHVFITTILQTIRRLTEEQCTTLVPQIECQQTDCSQLLSQQKISSYQIRLDVSRLVLRTRQLINQFFDELVLGMIMMYRFIFLVLNSSLDSLLVFIILLTSYLVLVFGLFYMKIVSFYSLYLSLMIVFGVRMNWIPLSR